MIKMMLINGVGAKKTVNMPRDTKIADIISNPEYAELFTGSSFTFNSNFLTTADMDKTIGELAGDAESAFLACIKDANGNM